MTPNHTLHKNPSLCIPKVDKGICEKDIREVFKKLNFGLVERIDIVSWKTCIVEAHAVFEDTNL